jgi:uncharacterized protein (TIGR02145 family)
VPSGASVSTISVTNIGEHSAIFWGLLNSGTEIITEKGFVYGINPNPTTADNVITDPSVLPGSYSLTETRLSSSTEYYVKAYAIASGDTIYGNEWNFTTASTSPSTVEICGQIWSTRNLEVTTYRNGDIIPQVTSQSAWASRTSGAWCYYNNDPASEAIYGKLYNWYAAHDSRGLAPSGYHVPTNSEWTTLVNCLDGSTVAGGKMKETGFTHWDSPNTGATNSSGFTALPGGFRRDFGSGLDFGGIGYNAWFWNSSSYSTDSAKPRTISSHNSGVSNPIYGKACGFSIRVIKN